MLKFLLLGVCGTNNGKPNGTVKIVAMELLVAELVAILDLNNVT